MDETRRALLRAWLTKAASDLRGAHVLVMSAFSSLRQRLFRLGLGCAVMVSPIAFAETLDSRLNDIVVTDGSIVVVGGFQENSGVIVDSPNGSDWFVQPVPSGQGLWAICHGDRQFVAVGSKGVVLNSPAGTEWKVAAQIPEEHWLFDVMYANGHFVAGGVRGLYLSPDARTWRRVHKDSNVYGLTYGNGLYVAVGYGGRIFTSSEGHTWTRRDSGTTFMLRSVAFGNGVFIAVGGEGQHGMVMSSDGIEWFQASSGSKAQLMDIVFANGMFYLVGGVWDSASRKWKAGTIEYSTDGRNWVTYFAHGKTRLDAIAAGRNEWFVVGDKGYVGRVGKTGFGLDLTDVVNDRRSQLTTTRSEGENVYVLPQLHIEAEGDGVTLRWKSDVGLSYRIRRSTDFKTWEDTGISYAGTGAELEHYEIHSAEVHALFFRLEIYP